MQNSERLLLRTTLTAALVLRAIAFFRYRFDSDEQQHLHVAWGWTAGLLPYRDLFDNHAPLFHFLMAPLLWLAGERPDILLWMRAPMLVLFAVVLWCTWLLGRRLYDDRVATWAVALLALFPSFFLKSLELRNDNLWNALWMVTLAILTAGAFTRRRAFLSGLVLGAAAATSAKTSMLLIGLALAAAVTWLFVLRRRDPAARIPTRALGAFAAGLTVVPVVVLAAFAAAGAADDLLYCTLTFNYRLSLVRELALGRIAFPFALAGVLWLAWHAREGGDPRRYFLAIFCGVYTVTLGGLWLLISPRDLLPLMPIAAIFAAAAVTTLRRPVGAFAAVALLSTIALWYYAGRFRDGTSWHTTMMEQALRLTHPGEPLIDIKGETIYRRRPFFYAFENVTRAQIAHGIIQDTLPEDVIRTRTYVAQADGPMWPPRGRAFLSDNFVNLGRLRAAGQWIAGDGSFSIAIPGDYVVLNADGLASGNLDGTPVHGSRQLGAGPHHFSRTIPGEQVAVLWAPAYQRGHSPFHLRDLVF